MDSTWTDNEMNSWLGPAADEITPEQRDQLRDANTRIKTRYPDEDAEESRTEALSAALMLILGDATLKEIADRWHEERASERNAMAALTGALIVSPGSEVERATAAGVARATVRKALGK